MIRAGFLAKMLILFPLFALTLGAAGKPNIVMINVNDTNDFVGFMDSQYSDQAITPGMDSLARKGVAFTNAHCATPACTPSRHGLFLGKYPFNTGLYRYNFDMREAEDVVRKRYPDLKSLNILLREQGYTTYGLGHNLGITDEFATGNEWDHHIEARPSERITLDPDQSYMSKEKKSFAFGVAQNEEEAFGGFRIASEAIEILQQDHDSPFFLALGIREAHIPTSPPRKYFDLYQDFELQPFYEDDLEDVSDAGVALVKGGADYEYLKKAGAWETAIKSYLATLSFVDAQVGRVVEALENSAYKDNTIVVLWSDHGNSYGRKLKLTKFHLWDSATRVPLVIWDTRNPNRKGTCVESVSLVDLYPTLMSLTNTEGPTCLDGIDLTPWLDNPALAREQPAYTMMGRGNYGIRNRDWRYIRYFNGEEELYHTKTDREELRNLIHHPEHSDQVNYMRGFLPKHEAPMIKLGLGKMVFHDADKAAAREPQNTQD